MPRALFSELAVSWNSATNSGVPAQVFDGLTGVWTGGEPPLRVYDTAGPLGGQTPARPARERLVQVQLVAALHGRWNQIAA